MAESVFSGVGVVRTRGREGTFGSNGIGFVKQVGNLYIGAMYTSVRMMQPLFWFAPDAPQAYIEDDQAMGAMGADFITVLGPLAARLPRAIASGLGYGVARGAAYGFKNADDFAQFGKILNSGLADAGFGGTKALLQGSAVTGKSFRTGKAFDAGRVSDFDIVLAGPDILAKARQLGIGLRSGGTRTGPLSAAQVQQLGLGGIQSTLSKSAGRPVNFMIYGDAGIAASRAPSIGF